MWVAFLNHNYYIPDAAALMVLDISMVHYIDTVGT